MELENYCVRVNFKSLDSSVSMFDISRALSCIFLFYYKGCLLREIINEIMNGTDPIDIVTFNNIITNGESVRQCNYIMRNIHRFKKKSLDGDNVQNTFMKLGDCYSIFPQERFEVLRLLKEYYRSTNIIFKEYDLRPLTPHKFGVCWNMYIKEGIIEGFAKVSNEVLNILNSQFKNKSYKNKVWKNIKDEITNNNRRYLNLFKEMLSDLEEVQNLLPYIKSNDIPHDKADNFVINNFDNFYRCFNFNVLPLIAIYNRENNFIKFLGTDIFAENESNMYIELISISHNSPYMYDIKSNPTLLSLLLDMLMEKLPKYLRKNEMINKLEYEFLQKIDCSELSAEQKNDFNRWYKELLPKSRMKKEISKIKCNYIRDNFLRYYSNLVSDFRNNLNEIKLDIDEGKSIKIFVDRKNNE